MPLLASWVDHLFAKLSVRWGAAFMRQWPDTDPDLVKADWAEVLDGVTGASLSYALRYLPAAPCNAVQFRELCRRAPEAAAPALAAPEVKADPERVRSVLAGLARPAGAVSAAQQCADNILRIVRGRGSMSFAQRSQLVAMAHRLTAAQKAEASAYVPEFRDGQMEEFA